MSAEQEPTPPQSKPGEILVFIIRSSSAQCDECGVQMGKGSFIRLVEGKPRCLECADLDRLDFLPSGNVALTRRATKYSPLRAVVLQWSRSRKRYERQGIMVAGEAIERAEKECLSDAEQRERNRLRAAMRREVHDAVYVKSVAEAILALFPGCPKKEAAHIAEWTCQKHSGRVGRSAAAKEFDAQALRLAVIAHIRHEHTPYDALLMKHDDRGLARQQVREAIDAVLAKWERAA